MPFSPPTTMVIAGLEIILLPAGVQQIQQLLGQRPVFQSQIGKISRQGGGKLGQVHGVGVVHAAHFEKQGAVVRLKHGGGDVFIAIQQIENQLANGAVGAFRQGDLQGGAVQGDGGAVRSEHQIAQPKHKGVGGRGQTAQGNQRHCQISSAAKKGRVRFMWIPPFLSNITCLFDARRGAQVA